MLERLKKEFSNYGWAFERDILKLGYSLEDIDDAVKSGNIELIAYDRGQYDIGNVYCWLIITNESGYTFEFKSDFIGFSKIESYFTGLNNEYGYRCGLSALNKINLSTQMYGSIELKSLLVNEEIIVKVPVSGVTITVYPLDEYNGNYIELMYQEAFDNYRGYFDCSIKDAVSKAKKAGVEVKI